VLIQSMRERSIGSQSMLDPSIRFEHRMDATSAVCSSSRCVTGASEPSRCLTRASEPNIGLMRRPVCPSCLFRVIVDRCPKSIWLRGRRMRDGSKTKRSLHRSASIELVRSGTLPVQILPKRPGLQGGVPIIFRRAMQSPCILSFHNPLLAHYFLCTGASDDRSSVCFTVCVQQHRPGDLMTSRCFSARDISLAT